MLIDFEATWPYTKECMTNKCTMTGDLYLLRFDDCGYRFSVYKDKHQPHEWFAWYRLLWVLGVMGAMHDGT